MACMLIISLLIPVTLKPAALYGRLEARTELFIRPKMHHHGEGSIGPPSVERDALQDNVPKAKLDPRETVSKLSAKETNLNMGLQEQTEATKASMSTKVLPNIWNLIGNIFSYSSDKKHEDSYGTGEMHAVKDSFLNLIHMDSIFRVCQTQPPSVQGTWATSTFQKCNTVHVFPWNTEFPALEANIKVSYGLITRLLSPRLQHQESKQNLVPKKEKQMINTEDQKQPSHSENLESRETFVVQIIWNEFEDLKNAIMSKNYVERLHVGKVWVSPISEVASRIEPVVYVLLSETLTCSLLINM